MVLWFFISYCLKVLQKSVFWFKIFTRSWSFYLDISRLQYSIKQSMSYLKTVRNFQVKLQHEIHLTCLFKYISTWKWSSLLLIAKRHNTSFLLILIYTGKVTNLFLIHSFVIGPCAPKNCTILFLATDHSGSMACSNLEF
jgi:hypothetical protein